MNQDSIIKALAVLAAVVLVLFVGYAIVKSYLDLSHVDTKIESDAPATLDANIALKSTIDTLETSWEKEQDYNFRVTQDPLHLGRVIKDFSYAQSGRTETEEDSDLRLTATVVDANPKAIIKFRGKSYVVQVGESVEQIYRVVSIEKRRVVLQSAGGTVTLIAKPLGGTEKFDDGSDYSISGSANNGNY